MKSYAKHICRMIFILGLIFAGFLPKTAMAEVYTVSAVGEYTMSDYETPSIAEERAIAYAKQHAAEKVDVYVETYSRSQNMELTQDSVKTIAASVKNVISQKVERQSLPTGDIRFIASVSVEVDTNNIERILREKAEQHQRDVERYINIQFAIKKQEEDYAKLKQKIAEAKGTPNDSLKQLAKAQERITLSSQKLESAFDACEHKDFQKALAYCNESLSLNPGNTAAYYEIGSIYSKMKDYNQAIANFNKSIALREAPENYRGRGYVYCNMKDYTKANADFKKALALPADNPSVTVGLNCAIGVTYQYQGDFKNAISYYERAIKLDPTGKYGYLVEIYNNRAMAYQDMGMNDLALADYTRALAMAPKEYYLYSNRASIYLTKDMIREAILDCNKAIELNPNVATGYNVRAGVYLCTKDYRRALIDINKAIELNGESASNYGVRALTYIELGEYAKARQDVNRALKLNPTADMRKTLQYWSGVLSQAGF